MPMTLLMVLGLFLSSVAFAGASSCAVGPFSMAPSAEETDARSETAHDPQPLGLVVSEKVATAVFALG